MIYKFQRGGTSSFLTAPMPNLKQGSTETTDKKSDEDSLIPKNLLTELYKEGIPVDVDVFVQQMSELQRRLDMGLPVSSGAIAALSAHANKVVQHSKYLDQARIEAEKNNALGEIAVGTHGELYTYNKNGEIKAVSSNSYDPKKDGPCLTVNDLLTQRRFNHNEAFDFQLPETIRYNIGMSKISDYIKGLFSVIGDADTVQEALVDLATLTGKRTEKPTAREFETIKRIADEYSKIGGDAIFKVTNEVGSKNVQEAMNYIMNVLPRDMQVQLTSRFIAQGGKKEDVNKYLFSLIGGAIAANNKTKEKISIDYQQDINKAAGTKSGNTSSKTFYQTPNEQLFDGDLNQTEVLITDPSVGNQTGIKVKGVQQPALTTDEGNAVANLPLGIALTGTIGKYTDMSKIYMGEQKITEGMLNNIAYSQDKVAAVYMPSKPNGDIDWDSFHACSQAEKHIKEHNITDIDHKNQIHAQFGSYCLYDENDQLVTNTPVERYILTYGYTTDDHIADGNTMVEELTDDQEDWADELISQIYNKTTKTKYGVSKIANKQIWDDIFKVPVFIKADKFASGDAYRYGGHGSNMTPRSLEEDMISEQFKSAPAKTMYGNAAALYQE